MPIFPCLKILAKIKPSKIFEDAIGSRDPKTYLLSLKEHIVQNFEHNFTNLETLSISGTIKDTPIISYFKSNRICVVTTHKIYLSATKNMKEFPKSCRIDEQSFRISKPIMFLDMPNQSLYTFGKKGKYLITCRHSDSTMKIIDVDTSKIRTIISCEMITSVHYDSQTKKLYSGSSVGVLSQWPAHKLWSLFDTRLIVNPKISFPDHQRPIILITSCKKACLLLSISTDYVCVVRNLLTTNFYCEFELQNQKANIKEVKISKVGYIIFLMEDIEKKDCYFIVRRYNGDEVADKIPLKGKCHSFILDSSEYSIIFIEYELLPSPHNALVYLNYISKKREEEKRMLEVGNYNVKVLQMLDRKYILFSKKNDTVKILRKKMQ